MIFDDSTMSASRSSRSAGRTSRSAGQKRGKFALYSAALATCLLFSSFVSPAGALPGGSVTPSDPTGVSATAGDTEATITWSSGGSGNGGSCASDEYYVNVYDATQQQFPQVAESLPVTEGTTWYVDELTPSTRYYIEIESYGFECEEYSDGTGTAFFWTQAASSGSDPTAGSKNTKRAPRPVRHLTIDRSISGQITIAWQRPAKLNNKARQKRCAYTSSASADFGHIEYNYMVENLTTGEDIADVYFSTNQNHGSRDVTNIPTSPGHLLRVTVSAYSEQCDFWSNSRSFTWWSQNKF